MKRAFMFINPRYILTIVLLFFSLSTLPKTFLVFGGKTGWIGQKLMVMLEEMGHKAIAAESRLENREAVRTEIERWSPDCVINSAGRTGVPNVDWCEDNKQEAVRSNVLGPLNLADITYQSGIHMINIATGCIYEYDAKHSMGSGIGFKEEETPNFHGSFYSHTKTMLDDLLLNYPNVLNLRLRMPISSDLHPRNFITKITKYKKVVNIPNSMSILDDLLPLIPEMAERKLVGCYNFVNPGVISHNQILDLYREYMDHDFTYSNFTVEEQNEILKAKRSNNELDTSKLQREFPTLPSIGESMKTVFERMREEKK
ncbi:MAG TPA: NAD-dependent epimerase/dehydratase family protein [bacterium]|nr:NAD-dependent epimerase/dehydratase family protein [bacterium]